MRLRPSCTVCSSRISKKRGRAPAVTPTASLPLSGRTTCIPRHPHNGERPPLLDSRTLLALCCLLLTAPLSSSASLLPRITTASAAPTSTAYPKLRNSLRYERLQQQTPLPPFLVEGTSFASKISGKSSDSVTEQSLLKSSKSSSSEKLIPVSSLSRRLKEKQPNDVNRNGNNKPPPSNREAATALLLTRSGYNTAFGTQAMCWQSVNATLHPTTSDTTSNSGGSILDASSASQRYNVSSALYPENQNDTVIIKFPNPLVDDFPLLEGEVLLSHCFAGSWLQVQRPIEAIRGERLRTFQTYEYQVNVTLDLTGILDERKKDAILTATPNKSQVAIQIIHCVLGKSGVCTPFLHEQAYIKDYLERGSPPPKSTPGSIHGETHIHSETVLVDILPDQTLLQQSLAVPFQANVRGDYFVIVALQFYTGDATTNIAEYRWDMANAMAPQERIIRFQDPPIILEVTTPVRLLSYAIIGVASLVILFLIYQAVKHRKEPVLTLSQGDFLIVFLVSALTATICTFMMNPKNDLYCNLGSTLVLLPLQLMYAITAGRLWRINAVISPLLVQHMRKKTKWTNRYVGIVDALSKYSVAGFRLVKHGTDRLKGQQNEQEQQQLEHQQRDLRRSIPQWQLAVVVWLFVSPQVILQIAEAVWQRQERHIDFNEDQSMGRAMCWTQSTESIGSMIFFYSCLVLLGLICVVLGVAYSSRNLPSLFNETQVIYDSTFITVILILLGFGIVALTNTPTTSPDVQYMVWIAVTLCITLNSSLRIMLPKLKMIWRGEQVIVSKLVSDHHRKQREKESKQSQQSGRDPMLNVSGLGEGSFTNNLSFYNVSINDRSATSFEIQAASVVGNLSYQPGNYDSSGSSGLRNSTNSNPQPLAPLPLVAQTSTGDATVKSSNVDSDHQNNVPGGGGMDESLHPEDLMLPLGGKVQATESPGKVESFDSDEAVKRQSGASMAAPLTPPKRASDPSVSGRERQNRRLRWSPRAAKDTTSSSSQSKGLGNKSPPSTRTSLFSPRSSPDAIVANVFRLPLTRSGDGHPKNSSQRRRQSATLLPDRRKNLPGGGLQRNLSVPKGVMGRPQEPGLIRGRARPHERMLVTPDETPARRLVLKMVDLQEQLSSVNKKIISGLVVSAEEWDLLTSLSDKLHNTFENDVDFSWRERAEEEVNLLLPKEASFYGGPPNPRANVAHDEEETPRSRSPMAKASSFVIRRGSVSNPAETAILFRNIVDVRDRRKGLVKHKRCFIGKDAVDSIVYSGMAASREEAVQIGRAMVKDMHLFKTVKGDFDFDDDDRYYRFVDLDDCWSSSDEDDDSEAYPSIVEEEEDEVDLMKKSTAFREAVLTRDRTYRMQTYKDVFVGAEAVDSLVYAGVAATRWEAVQLGRRLAREKRLFKHVFDKHEFRDEHLFYRFCNPDEGAPDSQLFNADSTAHDSVVSGGGESLNRRNDLADKADAFRMYAEVRNRKHRLKIMKNVFVGSEAVDVLVVAGVVSSRTEAVELGNTLMKELRLFTSVRGDEEFADNRSYYRFKDKHLQRSSLESINKKVKQDDEPKFEELKAIAQTFQQMVEVEDRKYRFRTYENCFVGAEAVDKMLSSGLAESRGEAVQLARALCREFDLFKPLFDDLPFCDDYVFYRFCDLDNSASSAHSDYGRFAIRRKKGNQKSSRGLSSSLNSSITSDGLGRSRAGSVDDEANTGSVKNSPGSLRNSTGSLRNGAETNGQSEPADVILDDPQDDPFHSSSSFLEMVPEAGESKSGDLGLSTSVQHRKPSA